MGLDGEVGGGTVDAHAQWMCADWKRGELVRRHKDAKACDDATMVALTTTEMVQTVNKELWEVLKAHAVHCARVVAALDALYHAQPDSMHALVRSPPSSPPLLTASWMGDIWRAASLAIRVD